MTINNSKTTFEKARRSFWPTVALVALILCGWMACTRGGSDAHADNGGAAMKGIIAMMGVMNTEEHLYLIDTDARVIMMYRADNNRDLSLVSGRSYEADSLFVTKHTDNVLPFKTNGYSGAEVAATLKRFGNR